MGVRIKDGFMKKEFAPIVFIVAGAIILGFAAFGVIKYGDKLTASISRVFKSNNQQNENNNNELKQELEKLKEEIELLQTEKKSEQKSQPTTKRTETQTTISNTNPVIDTNNESVEQKSDFSLELSASRYFLPADGEAVSFLTVIIKDKNGKTIENFNKSIKFVTTAGNISQNDIMPKNGMASTQLISSMVSTNLNVVAKCGDVNSNNINLSFSSIENNTSNNQVNNDNIDIDSGDIQGIVGLYCGDGWGSGVIISSNGYILTSYHVVEGSKFCGVYIAFRETMLPMHKYNAIALDYYDKNLDVAMLRINEDAEGNNIIGTGESFSYFLPADKNIKIGDDIWLLGYPIYAGDISPIIMTKGIISGMNGDIVNTDIKMVGGNSGGPVLNSDEQIMGIAKYVRYGNVDVLGGFVNILKIKDWYNSLGRSWPQ